MAVSPFNCLLCALASWPGSGRYKTDYFFTQDAEYMKQASEAWEEAIKIAESTAGWKEEKNDKKTGDIVESTKNEKGKKIYR